MSLRIYLNNARNIRNTATCKRWKWYKNIRIFITTYISVEGIVFVICALLQYTKVTWTIYWKQLRKHISHQTKQDITMMTLSNGNISAFSGEFPSQRPVTRSFDVFFDLRLNKQLSNQSRHRWFETTSRSSWHHCNAFRLWLGVNCYPFLPVVYVVFGEMLTRCVLNFPEETYIYTYLHVM